MSSGILNGNGALRRGEDHVQLLSVRTSQQVLCSSSWSASAPASCVGAQWAALVYPLHQPVVRVGLCHDVHPQLLDVLLPHLVGLVETSGHGQAGLPWHLCCVS